ncbi:lytic transglycosylase [Pseudothermotoga hypogea DSM 11164 = NBRC 106472]|uniref:Lytic transglycosylase n=1 Tax=Pseudothermotoga hypogea DSM 11164 = NBRC 106472 TaxID=1123384 RepID=A0A0X1KPJ3_9THEM|nr:MULTISPECIES: lytic transglycosylase domain-containing protein [Pseudothermotoga]AJC73182.1 lytic transglycosylase [Pseudothermotoga hypogea DSM 11164 = NBRC 106472]MDI6863468.1 lytic transglycosylase domain-containing protein [Pseudothermotoga sp.]
MRSLKWLTTLFLLQTFFVLAIEVPDWFAKLMVETRSKHGLLTDDVYVASLYETILEVSEKYGVDRLLIIALIAVESEFRNVVGMHGELGLMQIKPETAEFVCRIYGLDEPEEGWGRLLWDHKLNVELGTLYLKYQLERFSGSVLKALEAYNGGNSKSRYAARVVDRYRELMNHSLADRGG